MLRYRVEDMTCGHCSQAIQKAVRNADPQAEIAVDLASKHVTVRSQVEPNRIEEAIRSAGYEPRLEA